MIKIFKLNKENINHCINLIFCNKEDFDYFQQIGWSKKQYLNQIDKKINYSFGISKNKKIIGFIIGDLINVEKKSEYEILFKSRKLKNVRFIVGEYHESTKYPTLTGQSLMEYLKQQGFKTTLYDVNRFTKTGMFYAVQN